MESESTNNYHIADALKLFEVFDFYDYYILDKKLKNLQKKYHPDNKDFGNSDIFLSLRPQYDLIKKAFASFYYCGPGLSSGTKTFCFNCSLEDLWIGCKNKSFCIYVEYYVYEYDNNYWEKEYKTKILEVIDIDIPPNTKDELCLREVRPYKLHGIEFGTSIFSFNIVDDDLVSYDGENTFASILVPLDCAWHEKLIHVDIFGQIIDLKLNSNKKTGDYYLFKEKGYLNGDLKIQVFLEMPKSKNYNIFKQDVPSKKKYFRPIQQRRFERY